MNPLCGWNVSAVRNTGLRYGIDPAGDILGCLFFHIRAELREFALRVKEFNIHIHLLQYDPRLLSKGISIGVLPAFSEASFDRVDIGDMPDTIGVAECLADWGTLLNKENKNSCVIMHSKRWHEHVPGAIARGNPRTLHTLMERCENIPSLAGLIALASIRLLNLAPLYRIQNLRIFSDSLSRRLWTDLCHLLTHLLTMKVPFCNTFKVKKHKLLPPVWVFAFVKPIACMQRYGQETQLIVVCYA